MDLLFSIECKSKGFLCVKSEHLKFYLDPQRSERIFLCFLLVNECDIVRHIHWKALSLRPANIASNSKSPRSIRTNNYNMLPIE